MKVVITGTLTDLWATPEEFADMPDGAIIDLIWEDLVAFLKDAKWEVVR